MASSYVHSKVHFKLNTLCFLYTLFCSHIYYETEKWSPYIVVQPSNSVAECLFSVAKPKYAVNTTGQSQHIQITKQTNQNSNKKHATGVKRGKPYESTVLLLVLLLIDLEDRIFALIGYSRACCTWSKCPSKFCTEIAGQAVTFAHGACHHEQFDELNLGRGQNGDFTIEHDGPRISMEE